MNSYHGRAMGSLPVEPPNNLTGKPRESNLYATPGRMTAKATTRCTVDLTRLAAGPAVPPSPPDIECGANPRQLPGRKRVPRCTIGVGPGPPGREPPADRALKFAPPPSAARRGATGAVPFTGRSRPLRRARQRRPPPGQNDRPDNFGRVGGRRAGGKNRNSRVPACGIPHRPTRRSSAPSSPRNHSFDHVASTTCWSTTRGEPSTSRPPTRRWALFLDYRVAAFGNLK